MSDAPAPRTDKLGGILVVLFIVGSAVGVVGWYLQSNSGGKTSMDTSGFDVAEPPPASAVVAPPPPPPADSGAPAVLPAVPAASSLTMLRVDESFKPVKPSTAPAAAAAASAPAPPPAANTAATTTAVKAPARKPFATPKLSGGGGIGLSSGFGNAVGTSRAPSGGSSGGAAGAQGASPGTLPPGVAIPDISGILKNVPGANSSPEVQKALQGVTGK
jgi:hypothetical protein